MGVVKWMKDPTSVQFRGIEAVRNSRRLIAVCGLVNGRNTAGQFVGFQPLVGVLMGPAQTRTSFWLASFRPTGSAPK